MKRPNGTGTITKMSGTRRKPYAVRVPARDRKGRVVQKYLSYHATQKEAWEALEAYRAQLSGGLAPAPADLGVTLGEVYELWSARKYEKSGKSSIASYKVSWTRLKRFSSIPIRNLGIDQWQSIIDEDERCGMCQSSINHDKLLMRALSKYAAERDWITKDYTEFIIIPSIDAKQEKGAFTEIELHKVYELYKQGFPGADAVLVLCYTGFRINEFMSLTRFSYDPVEKTLTGGSKTAAGKGRIIPIHPRIQPIIENWLAGKGDTLFTKKGRSISISTFRRSLFVPVMKEINRPSATPHWCRHTFASLLYKSGADELSTKRLMGHSDKDITEHYTHITLQQLRETINKIA